MVDRSLRSGGCQQIAFRLDDVQEGALEAETKHYVRLLQDLGLPVTLGIRGDGKAAWLSDPMHDLLNHLVQLWGSGGAFCIQFIHPKKGAGARPPGAYCGEIFVFIGVSPILFSFRGGVLSGSWLHGLSPLSRVLCDNTVC